MDKKIDKKIDKKNKKKKENLGIWTVENHKKVVHLHKYQQQVLSSTAKIVLMIAGTGGGKSSLTPIILADRMSKKRDCTVIFTEPTYYMLEHIAMPLVIDFFKDTYLQGKFKAKDMVYENRFGQILFKSADKPDFLEGIHADLVIADEVGQYKRRAYVVLSNRITLRDGQFFGLTTPYNSGWLYREPYHEWKTGNPDYDVINFPSIANPAFPVDEFNKKKKEMTEEEFSMRYLAEFVKLRGLVFEYFDENVEDYTEFRGTKYWTAMDFGFGHPTAILYFFEDEKGTVHVFDEYIATSSDYETHTANNIDRFKKYDIRRVYYDPSNPQGMTEMKKWFKTYGKEDISFIPANNRVKDGVRSVNTLLKNKGLFFNRLNCPEILSELDTCIYKDDEPTDEDTDLLDCLRYGVMGRESWKKPTVVKVRFLTEAEKHLKALFTPPSRNWLQDP